MNAISKQVLKFQLMSDAEQEFMMRRSAGCSRFVWSFALRLEQKTFEQCGKRLG